MPKYKVNLKKKNISFKYANVLFDYYVVLKTDYSLVAFLCLVYWGKIYKHD